MEIKELKKWCEELKELKQQKAEKQKEVDTIQDDIVIKETLISAYLEWNELDRFDFGDGLVYRQEQISAKITDKEAFREAIGAEEFETISSVNANTLKAIIKQKRQEAFDNGEVDFKMNGLEIKTYYNLNMRKN